MQGKALKRLASVANIAKLDMSPGSMVITSKHGGKGVLAWYYGIYFAGGIMVDSPEQLPDIPVGPEQFQAIAGLYDDNSEVMFEPGASGLLLLGGRVKNTLQYGPKPVSSVQETFGPMFATVPTVTIKTADLVGELNLLKGVATKNSTAPILSGVRLVAAGEAVGFLAANGSSMVYQARVGGQSSARVDVVPPVEEFIAALSTFVDEEWVGLSVTDRALIIKSENAVAKISLMAGEFPNLTAAFAGVTFDEKVSLPAASIRQLVLAARAYKSTGMATIRPAVTGGGIVIQTEETEIGQYEETVDGSVERLYGLSVDDLDMASKLSGDMIELSLSPERSLSLLKVGNRSLYINARAI